VAEELEPFFASNTCGGDVSRGITRGVYRNLSADSPAFKPGRARDRCQMAGTLEVPLLERNAILRGGENDFSLEEAVEKINLCSGATSSVSRIAGT
jgi:hypothetical protein